MAFPNRCAVNGLRLFYNLDESPMNTPPPCPLCNSAFTYADASMYVCPECAHEWPQEAGDAEANEQRAEIRDAVGNVLNDGDTVTVTKDLRVKGSS